MKYLFYLSLLFSIGCGEQIKIIAVQQIEFKSKSYEFNDDIENLVQKTKDGTYGATRYSFVSEHIKALKSKEIELDTISPISQNKWDSILNIYSFSKADEHIIEKAKEHDFLMFNEAHYSPLHRNYVKRLLPELSKLGYKNLALEAVGLMRNGEQFDTEFETRGYPMVHSGFYIKEPEFGNLIREAVRLGFNIIGYDEGSGVEREINGAKNIIKKIKAKGSPEKTIILCGWDHLKEGKTGTYWEYALAGRIKQYSGKDPLTINQTKYTERGQKIFEDSIYQRANINEPSILIDKEGNLFDNEDNKDWYDIMVFHPRTKYTNGIPGWITAEIPATKINLDKVELNCPCKVFLFDKNDDINKAVPLYVREIESIKNDLHLPMNKGEYKLIVTNKMISHQLTIVKK